MTLALVQVVEPADSYDPATIALFALFIASLVITSGLLLRDLLKHESDHRATSTPWLRQGPGEGVHPPSPHVPTPPAYPSPGALRNARTVNQQPPLWFRQVMTTHQGDIAEGIGRTVRLLLEAGNRGDIRGGFSLCTPEYVARQQSTLGLDPVELERMMRSAPLPAARPVAPPAISDVAVDPPNRASATVIYGEEGEGQTVERFRFVYDPGAEIWLVDDIESAPS